jgi:hypothetical protein
MKDSKKNFLNFSKKILPILSLVIVISSFFWKFFLKNQIPFPGDFVVGVYYPWLDYKWGFPTGVPVKNPITTDVPSFIFPMQTLAAEMITKAKLPLWNRLILGGAPLLANFQSAPFSPTNFVYFIFDKLTAWSIQIILQHIFISIFTYILLRHWKISNLGSLVGSISFSFSGYNLIWSQWNGHALAASFLPLLIYFTDRLLSERGSIINGPGITFVLALQTLSGYPQSVLYSGVATFILWLSKIKRNRNYISKTVFLGLFTFLSIGITAFQILPGAELLSLSQRKIEPHPYEWAFLPWSKTITFLAPDYFGNHATKNYWGPQDYTSNTGFVGVAVFVLASVAIFNSKFKQKVFLFSLLLVSLLLAFPTPLSIAIWRSGIFGMNAASAHRSLVLFDLSMAILASFGIDVFHKGLRIRLSRTLLPSYLIITGFFLTTLYLYFFKNSFIQLTFSSNKPLYSVGLRNLVLPLAVLILITFILAIRKSFKNSIYIFLFLVIFESFRFGWKFTPFSSRNIVYPQTPILEYLEGKNKPFRVTGNKVIPINMRMPYGIESLEGYDAVYPLRIAKFIAAVNSGLSDTNSQGRYATLENDTSPLLDLVNVKYYITLKLDPKNNPSANGKIPARFNNNRFKEVFTDKTSVILESKSALPRAFMVYKWEKLDSDDEILNRLLSTNFPLSEKILLKENPNIDNASSRPDSVVTYEQYDFQESVINTVTDLDGMLFISDSFYPGWHAQVDGKETKIYLADYAFMGIEIPKGKHSVKIYYNPESFRNGVIISVASLLSLVGFTSILWLKYEKK